MRCRAPAPGRAHPLADAPATLTIRDNDAFASAQFAMSTFSVNEAAGTATVNLVRFGTGNNAITAIVTAAGGSATAGQDFTNSEARVTFPAGDATAKAVTFSIVNDANREGDEIVQLALRVTAAGGGDVPAQEAGQSATLTIIDDDGGGPGAATVLSIAAAAPKSLTLAFDPAPGVSFYRIFSASLAGDFTQAGADIPASTSTRNVPVPFAPHLRTFYRLDACDAGGCRQQDSLTPTLKASVAGTDI